MLLLKPRQAGSSQVISTVKKHSGLQNFCNYANMTRNLLKPYEGSSRREKCFRPNLVVWAILKHSKKKMKELNRHYDEPQFFTAAKLKYIT